MEVTLVQKYNPEWPTWFEEIKELLGKDVRLSCLRIEHVGSTSVPGMIAKPIIDLILVIRRADFEKVKECLKAVGYEHVGDQGIRDREVFKIPDESLRSRLPAHHLYVCPSDSEELRRETAFREFLTRNPEYARVLSELKWSLAEQFHNDRQTYMKGKAALCTEITQKALSSTD